MRILSLIQKAEWHCENKVGKKETKIQVKDKDLLDQLFRNEDENTSDEDVNTSDEENCGEDEIKETDYEKTYDDVSSDTEDEVIEDSHSKDEKHEGHSIKKTRLESLLKKLKIELLNIDMESILKKRLVALLNKAGISGEDEDIKLETYEKALGVSSHGYRIVHKRDVDEIFVNNYNPEWILNWNANMDLQLCLDFFAVVTYISDYYGKDDSGTMKFIKEALKEAGNESLKTRLSLVVHQFLTHRQIGECEAYFRILPHLNMKHSNIEAVFVQTGFKQNRSKFLKKLTELEAENCSTKLKITNRTGIFTEKPSVIDKYGRRDLLENPENIEITYMQFSKRYNSTNIGPKKDEMFISKDFVKGESPNELAGLSKLDFIVTHEFEMKDALKLLPKFIKINNLRPGEPQFMKLRSIVVARIHKFNRTKKSHEFYLSELQLYKPFLNEDDLAPDSLENCKKIYDEISDHNGLRKITNIKRILMEHLESVEEGTERAQDEVSSKVAAGLDAAIEQDNADCGDEDMCEHPDFLAKDPTDLDIGQSTSQQNRSFKKITLYSDQQIQMVTLRLDRE